MVVVEATVPGICDAEVGFNLSLLAKVAKRALWVVPIDFPSVHGLDSRGRSCDNLGYFVAVYVTTIGRTMAGINKVNEAEMMDAQIRFAMALR